MAAQPCDPTAAQRAGSWVHAAAAAPHQAFTSDPAGVVSDAVRFCPFATGNDVLYAKAPAPQGGQHDRGRLHALVLARAARSLHAAHASGLPRPTQAEQGARCEDTGNVGQAIGM